MLFVQIFAPPEIQKREMQLCLVTLKFVQEFTPSACDWGFQERLVFVGRSDCSSYKYSPLLSFCSFFLWKWLLVVIYFNKMQKLIFFHLIFGKKTVRAYLITVSSSVGSGTRKPELLKWNPINPNLKFAKICKPDQTRTQISNPRGPQSPENCKICPKILEILGIICLKFIFFDIF